MASIRKRTLPSGENRWLVDYQDQAGRRRARQFRTKKEADAFELRARQEVSQGLHTPDSESITVGTACDLWLQTVELNGREATTLDQYRGHVRNHIAPALGSAKLARLTTPMVVEFRDRLLRSCTRPMARKVLTSLKSILKDAQRRGKVAQNVALPVGIDSRTEDREDDGAVIPPKEHVQILLGKVPDAWRPVLVTAALCGLRPSELRGLTWEHVDFDAKMIRVRQRANNRQQLGPVKTRRGNRDVPMSPLVLNTLRAWRLACPKGQGGFVFPSTTGGMMHIPSLSIRLWRPLLKECGLLNVDGTAPYHFKHLRHFAASSWIKAGANPKWVQRVMGHSSIRVTMDIYAHLWRDDAEDEAFAAAAERHLMAGCNTDATRRP